MLTEPQLMAAELVAHDRLSIPGIAERVGVGRSTIRDWKTQPEFQTEVERLLNSWAEAIEKRGIADKRRRLFRLNDRWRRGQAFIEKRARLFKQLRNGPKSQPIELEDGRLIESPPSVADLLASVPGGETGMVAWKFKTLHVGKEDYEKVVEFEYDTGLQDALNKIEEQAAIETGQWKPKQEISISGTGGGPIQVTNLSALSDDELRTLIGLARKLEAPGSGEGTPAPQPEPDAELVSE